MEEYFLVNSGDAPGLYFGARLVASVWQLEEMGLAMSELSDLPQLTYHKIDCNVNGHASYKIVTNTKDFGFVLGQRLTVQINKFPKPDVLFWDGARVVLDDHLPASVARAIPNGFATPRVSGKDWETFLIGATAAGLWR